MCPPLLIWDKESNRNRNKDRKDEKTHRKEHMERTDTEKLLQIREREGGTQRKRVIHTYMVYHIYCVYTIYMYGGAYTVYENGQQNTVA